MLTIEEAPHEPAVLELDEHVVGLHDDHRPVGCPP
jgi:hypothetical protein